MLSDGRFEKQKGDSNLEKEDRIRQKEQWKQLSPAEKWQYFIDYYLWITVGVVAGIRLENNDWVRRTGWYQHEAAVGLADGMKNPDLAVALLEEILNAE